MPWASVDEQGRLTLRLRVTPRAKQEGLAVDGERLRVRLKAPPVDGKANTALAKLLAKRFGVAKGAVHLVAGERGREKTVRIDAPSSWPEGLPGPPDGLSVPDVRR